MSLTFIILTLVGAASLPYLVTWLAAYLPSKRVYASQLRVGNPLALASRPVEQVVSFKPLLHLSRVLAGKDIQGYILGARHLPLEQTAQLMSRYIKGPDPALQLYAQSILQSGVDKLQQWQETLQHAAPKDERCMAWLVEIGLTLAHRNIATRADRSSILHLLVNRAQECLRHYPKPSAHLLQNLVHLYLEVEAPFHAQAYLQRLPVDSAYRLALEPAVAHALKRQVAGGQASA